MIITSCVTFFDFSLMTQFIIVVVTGIAVVMLLALRRPFVSSRRNKVEMLEECAIMITMYHIFCFTEFIPDPKVRLYVGYSLYLLKEEKRDDSVFRPIRRTAKFMA